MSERQGFECSLCEREDNDDNACIGIEQGEPDTIKFTVPQWTDKHICERCISCVVEEFGNDTKPESNAA